MIMEWSTELEEYIAAHIYRCVLYRYSGEIRLFGELKLYELNLSACEGVNVKSRGKTKYSRNFLCGGKLGVYNHSETELVFYIFRLAVI